MTVFCLVELDGGAGAGSAGSGAGGAGGVAEVSLRAITLARGLAAGASAGAPAASAEAPNAPGGGGGRGVAAVVFGGGGLSAGELGLEGLESEGLGLVGPESDGLASDGGSGLVADLAAYGVTDVYAVAGIDGYAPLAWARVLQWLLSESSNPGLHPSPDESPRTAPHPSSDERAHPAPGQFPHPGPDEPARHDESPHPAADLSPHHGPEISAHAVVAAGTERGNEVLAHLGAITGLPMAANCTQAVDNGGGAYSIVRQRWAGLLLEEAVLEAPVALLTVAADAVPAVPAEVAPAVTVHHVSPSVDGSDLAVRAVETPAGAGGASLATARVVVGGGRVGVDGDDVLGTGAAGDVLDRAADPAG